MKLLEGFRTRRSLKIQQDKFELARIELATEQLSNIFKKEADPSQRPVPTEPGDSNWIMIGAESGDISDVTGYNHYEMLAVAYKAFATNLYAKAIVRNLSKFVLGKGPTIKPDSENEKVKDTWDNFAKMNKWSLREKELVKRVFRDGEIFIRRFVDKNNGDVKIRFMRAEKIRNPVKEGDLRAGEQVTFGIGTDPNDVEDVRTYYHCDAEGNLIEAIEADEIIHIKIFVDSDVKRGMSALLTALPMIAKYLNWLDDRIILNKVRSAIALIKTVKGTSNTVESLREAQMAQHQSADRNKQQAFAAGTVITASEGIEYEMVSPNINAPDVKDDGRAMLLAVAAGCGMPEMMLTADYSNANYSSSVTAQNPFVREIEDWQDFFGWYYNEIFVWVISAGKDYGEIPKDEEEGCALEWPPLILADIMKNNQARKIQHESKILSRKTWRHKEGLNSEEEEQNIIEEDGMDIYKVPFNLPIAPANQWGAIDEGNESEWSDEE